MSLDELDKVARLRLIGSPPHDLQHLGTLEKLNYVGTIGRIRSLGTLATLGTVLLTIHVGSIGKINRVGTQRYLGSVNRVAGGRFGSLGRLGTAHYVERLGTVGHVGSISGLGTVGYVARLGTVTYARRLGTIGHLGSSPYVGTLNRLGGGRIGTVGHIGSGPYIGTLNRLGGGRLGSLARVGTVHYQERLGTVGRMGTVGFLGTLRYAGRLGTVGYIPRLGTVGRMGTVQANIAAQDIAVGVDIQTRYQAPISFRGTTRLGPGSFWSGSWQGVGSFARKFFLFQVGNLGTSGGGSVAIIAGARGTGKYDGTFTLRGPWRVGKGSPGTYTFIDPVSHVRPWVRQHGGGSWISERGGSVSVFLGRQA